MPLDVDLKIACSNRAQVSLDDDDLYPFFFSLEISFGLLLNKTNYTVRFSRIQIQIVSPFETNNN